MSHVVSGFPSSFLQSSLVWNLDAPQRFLGVIPAEPSFGPCGKPLQLRGLWPMWQGHLFHSHGGALPWHSAGSKAKSSDKSGHVVTWLVAACVRLRLMQPCSRLCRAADLYRRLLFSVSLCVWDEVRFGLCPSVAHHKRTSILAI